MKWGKITLLIILFSFNGLAQEICNNAIDDDGDGLIDMNDTDCICNPSTVGSLPSYIPNASFENFSQCPTGPSQISFANSWSQCTLATADYMNECGYVFSGVTAAGLTPFPDGNAIVGAIFSENWREYVGAELSSTLEAGKNYQLTFNIASLPVNGDGESCNSGVIEYGALNITIYGSGNANSLPVNTSGSPTGNQEWVAIGSAVYQPVSQWGEITINFTPSVDINAVMLGAPDSLPTGYDQTTCYPYFLFDNLVLNESSAFGATITATGNFCSGNLMLAAVPAMAVSNNATYQWYKEGIAISGATSQNFTVGTDESRLGNYNVKITDTSACYYSRSYTVASYMASPVITSIQNNCTTGTGIITLAPAAYKYSFNNGESWTSGNVSSPLQAGTYFIKTKSIGGCVSAAIEVTIAPTIIDAPVVEDVVFCQYSGAAALTATGSNLLWYTSATGGTGSGVAPIPSTSAAGVTAYYVSQTIGECESERTALYVFVTPAPQAPLADEVVYYCQFAQTVPLSASGSNLLWYTSATGGTGSVTAPTPQSNVAGTTTYYVSQNPNGCESSRRAISVVTLAAPPAPDTKLFVELYHNDTGHELTAYGENLTWYDANGNILAGTPVASSSEVGSTTYFVSQTINGCESFKAEVIVIVIPKLVAVEYPKFFTPNGDGIHDHWNIKLPEMATKGELLIYDRYGKMIHKGITGEHGWDGTFNGTILPATDYWFSVIYTEYGVRKEFTSHFSLVR